MKARELRRILASNGCREIRQRGSHLIIGCGECRTTVPLHGGTIPIGTLAAIRRQLAPCLGENWLP